MIPYKQLALADIFTDFQNKFQTDKYTFLSILDETINFNEIVEKTILLMKINATLIRKP